MEIEKSLFEYKEYIVFAGLIIGMLKIFDFLPAELALVGTYAKYLYAAIILAAAFAYWKFHWNNYGPKPVSYTKTVTPRDMGKKPEIPPSKVFDTFKKD